MHVTYLLHTLLVLYVDIDDCCPGDNNSSDVDLIVCNPILFLNTGDPFGNSKPSVSVQDPSLTEQVNEVPLITKVAGHNQINSRKLAS